MGNLYTHIVGVPNQRLKILSKLKYLFGCSPKDWTEIEKLRNELAIQDDRIARRKKTRAALFPNHASYIKKWGSKKGRSSPESRAHTIPARKNCDLMRTEGGENEVSQTS